MHVEIFDLPIVSKKNRMKSGRGRVYKDQVVVDFERDLFDAIQAEWRGDIIEEGPVAVSICITVPDKRRRDLQNFSDTICDVMNNLVYKDDSQITTLNMKKIYGKRWCLSIQVRPDIEAAEDTRLLSDLLRNASQVSIQVKNRSHSAQGVQFIYKKKFVFFDTPVESSQ